MDAFETPHDPFLPEPEAPAKPKTAAKAAPKAASTTPLIRKSATKALEIAAAPEPVRQVLASLVGVSDASNVPAVVVACMEGGRGVARPVRDIEKVVAAADIDKVIVAATLAEDADAFAAAWAVLVASGGDLPKKPPAQHIKAAAAFARAVHDLPPESWSRVRAATELAS